ncbi:MAG TPA: glycoside hydrolase family 16 protein [Candidatus Saccharimonadales bacterium]
MILIAGSLYLLGTKAAGGYVTAEPEIGSRSGSVAAGDTTDASGSASVKFMGPVSGAILFEDDFTGPAGSLPDSAKWGDWSACAYNGTAAIGLIRCGADEKLDGAGHLSLPASPTYGTAISTANKFSFMYGTMSAWVKMPPQVGYWPAFWELNSRPNGQDEFPLGEADAMEGYTTWPTVYHATGHNWTGNAATDSHDKDNYCAANSGINLGTTYVKFSARIEPNKITYYYNDIQCGAAFTPNTNPGKPWGFGPSVTRPNWLILDLAVGGADGQQQPATQPAAMLVDRVEVRGL